MLTRREFISILMVMGALFFLFQFMNVFRQKWSSNLQNLFARSRDRLKTADTVYTPSGTAGHIIAVVGTAREDVGKIVEDWAYYQKWTRQTAASFRELETRLRSGKEPPELVVVNAGDPVWTSAEELEGFRFLLGQGIHVVLPALPPLSALQRDSALRQLLGIKEVRQENIRAKGVTLYDGFLLGGKTIYKAETGEDEKRQDLPLEMPWFTLTSGTKVYMKAMLDDPDVDVQDEPPVLWRQSGGNGFVFVVNGDYFQGVIGLGLLSAMLHQTRDITVYPVVNAQELVVANAPVFADENDAVFQRRYSQSMRGTLRDVIWTTISRVASDSTLGFSCMTAPQLDYSDAAEPRQEDLLYYLRSIQILEGEAGLSGWQHSDVPMEEKLRRDAEFWDVQAESYRFSSFYQSDLGEEEVRQALEQPLLGQVQTVVEQRDGGSRPLDYRSDAVTRQQAIADGFSYTYLDDLRVKSAETALGYTSVLADLEPVLYPQTGTDGWETYSKELSRNIGTRWKAFTGFDGTTVTQTDDRVREFLALHYTVSLDGQRLELDTEGAAPAWFLVRLRHGEPARMEGGTFRQLEPGAWLAEVENAHAVLWLGKEEERYYTP